MKSLKTITEVTVWELFSEQFIFITFFKVATKMFLLRHLYVGTIFYKIIFQAF